MSTSASFARLKETAWGAPPCLAIVLGSGMSDVARRLKDPVSVPFIDVPGMAPASVLGHQGRLLLGDWLNKRVLIFAGRLHQYEGHADRAIVSPIQAARFLRATTVLFTNAAGGICDGLAPGSFMAIREHIEWNRGYASRYPGVPARLARSSPYSPRLTAMLAESAQALGIELFQGVYVATTGPNYETPAEIRAMRACGADSVGMSTIREAQAAVDLGMECAAISCVTNRAAGLGSGPINHEDVLATVASQARRLTMLLEVFVGLL